GSSSSSTCYAGMLRQRRFERPETGPNRQALKRPRGPGPRSRCALLLRDPANRESPMADAEGRSVNPFGVFLASIPVASFCLQYALSVASGTEALLFQHLTVTYVDWIFVPFNYLVADVIDWRRGKTLYVLALLAVVLCTTTHAFWEYHLT